MCATPSRLCLVIALAAQSALAQAETIAPFDVVAAVSCKLDAGAYIGFAMNLGDDEIGYKARGWVKEESGTAFLSRYRLPVSIEVAGYRTSTIVFSGSGIAAILDSADPAAVAAPLGIVNSLMSREQAAAALGLTAAQAAQLPPVTGFRGEHVRLDKTEVDPSLRTRLRTRIVESVSNDPHFPGKTLLGCSYSIELADQ